MWMEGRNEGDKRGIITRAPNHCGGAEWLREVQESRSSVKYFLKYTVHLLPKDLRFEHGGAKRASCPGRHIISLRLCADDYTKTLNHR